MVSRVCHVSVPPPVRARCKAVGPMRKTLRAAARRPYVHDIYVMPMRCNSTTTIRWATYRSSGALPFGCGLPDCRDILMIGGALGEDEAVESERGVTAP